MNVEQPRCLNGYMPFYSLRPWEWESDVPTLALTEPFSFRPGVSFSSQVRKLLIVKPSDYLNMEPSSVLSALIAVVLGFSEYTYFFSMLDQIIDTVWQSPQRLVCDDKIPDALFSDSPI